MSPQEKEIKEFYDTVVFPGLYTKEDITNVEDYLIYERYLDFIEANDIKTILDIGCGSGYITNIIANHFPHIQITAVDFSDTIHHGEQISNEIGLTNVKWCKENFINANLNGPYDLVLANGSLHHMPDFNFAIKKAKLLAGKFLMVGLYNKYGKWMQRKIRPKFITECFELDQIKIPFELSFTNKEALSYFKECTLLRVTPSIFSLGVDFFSLFRGKWGGFMFYYFSK
jgi:SAM-dependent methyltransferase